MSISQNFPAISPSLSLNFARSKTLDPRITFTRTSSATRINERGLVEVISANSPRFDHKYENGVVKSLGLLVEEQRTNLLKYSQSLATSPWGVYSGGGFSVSNNVTTSPDGTTNASQMNSAYVTGGDSIYQDVSVSGTGTYTLSIFVKGNSCNSITLAAFFLHNTTQGFSFNYNPLTGQAIGTGGGSNHTVVSYPNGWYRIYFTVTGTNALNGTLRFQVYSNATGITYLWGAQLEQGSFPTSYIPTTSSTVTRNPDNVSMTGTNFSSWYNQSEGTIICNFIMRELSPPQNETSIFNLKDGDVTSLYEQIRLNRNNNSGTIRFRYRVDNTDEVVVSSINSISVNNISKTATTYNIGYQAMSFNGDLVTRSNSLIPTPDNLVMGRFSLGSDQVLLNGTITQLIYYPKQFTGIQLQTLTK